MNRAFAERAPLPGKHIWVSDRGARMGLAAAGLVVALVAFGQYYRGLAPSLDPQLAPFSGVIADDTVEFPLVVHRLAIAHPTGYPLYVLTGKLFSILSPGETAYDLNLMSAVFAAAAVGIVCCVSLRVWRPLGLTPGHYAGAVLGALLFGLGPTFYSQATIVEVYTLNALFVAGLLLLTLEGKWYWLAPFVALGLTHHRTIVLVVPAILAFVALTRREADGIRDWRTCVRGAPSWRVVAVSLCPLLLYLYVPLRGHLGSLDGTYQNTFGGFLAHVSAVQFAPSLTAPSPGPAVRWATLFYRELGWFGLGLSALGLTWLVWRRRWAVLALTGLTFALCASFAALYSVSDQEVFFIPAFLALGTWAGLGAGAGLGWLWRRHRLASAALATAGLAFVLGFQKGESRAEHWQVHDRVLDALFAADEGGTIIGILGDTAAFQYFQEATGLRPDVRVLLADTESERLAAIQRLMQETPRRAVYLTRECSGVPERWSLSAAGSLIEVNREPRFTPPANMREVGARVTPDIQVVGYEITYPTSHSPTGPIRLALSWKVERAVQRDLRVSVRLLDADGEVTAVVDKAPVHWAYPTRFWRVGEFVGDAYDLYPRAPLKAGLYVPLIILYEPVADLKEVGRVRLAPVMIDDRIRDVAR